MTLRPLLFTAALLTSPALAQTAPAPPLLAPPRPAQITFHLERPGLPVPVWTLTIAEDGAGEYLGSEILAPKTLPYDPPGAPSVPRPFHRTIALTAPTTAKIFAAAHSLHQFHAPCASKAKNIADTGAKTLSYTGPDGAGACAYNYTENKTVQGLTELFQTIAFTLDIGRKLDFDHRFDRLGLDAETQILAQALKDGQAAEILTLTPTLEAIAQDTEVIQRVRLRAASLLQKAREDLTRDAQ